MYPSNRMQDGIWIYLYGCRTNRQFRRRHSGACARHRLLYLSHIICCFLLLATACPFSSCSRSEQPGTERDISLTPDERYLIELYMKINEIEKNLQDNPKEMEEKREKLRQEYDPERLRKILFELERNPYRWIAVYRRVNVLLKRSAAGSNAQKG